MGNWTERDLRRQYGVAKANGWIPHFVEAGDAIADDDIDGATLMAIGSRETNMRNIKGDFRDGFYHGYSLMQLDIGSHPDWIASDAWRDVRQAIHKGADALDEKREQILDGQGEALTYKGHKFQGKNLNREQLKHTALAAYNSGLGAYYSIVTDGDPDKRTTGHDYGRDVLAREVYFRRWMDADGFLSTPSAARGVADDAPDVSSPVSGGSSGSDASGAALANGTPAGDGAGAAPGPTTTIQTAGEVTVEAPAPQVPIAGGSKDDDPKPVTQSWSARAAALITGSGISVLSAWQFVAAHPSEAVIITLVVCGALVGIAYMVRSVILDRERIRVNSDPRLLNVK